MANKLHNILAVDCETTGRRWESTAFCVSFAWRDSNELLQSTAINLYKRQGKQIVQDTLKSYNKWVFHVAKFDIARLMRTEILIEYPNDKLIHDTHLISHLLNENRDNSLKGLAKDILGYEDLVDVEIKSGPKKGQFRQITKEMWEIKEAKKRFKLNKEDGYDKIPWDIIERYAKKDAEFTLLLMEELWPQICRQDKVKDIYKKELKLIPALISMEDNGIKVDRDFLGSAIQRNVQNLCGKKHELIEITEDEYFNPGSPQQVLAWLKYIDCHIKDTSKNTLEILKADGYDFARIILEYRKIDKLLSTYLKAIKDEQVMDILHPQYKSTVRTGRMASGEHKGD